jgi:hypothetical protein
MLGLQTQKLRRYLAIALVSFAIAQQLCDRSDKLRKGRLRVAEIALITAYLYDGLSLFGKLSWLDNRHMFPFVEAFAGG